MLMVGGLVISCSGGGGSDRPDADVGIDASPIDAALDAPADAPTVDAGPDGSEGLECGTGTQVFELPANGLATGSASATTPGNLQSVSCQGRGAETVYLFTVEHPVTMVATTDGPGTTLDTVLYLRRACGDSTTELTCNDNTDASHTSSRITADLTPGTYYLVVDGRTVGAAGNYALSVSLFEGVGAPCTGPNQCAPDYTCRAIAPSTQTTCERHPCDDGRDDDGDGAIDYPADPGCSSATDDTEDDTCPGIGCPVCSDGLDNDGDGLTDYPLDLGCVAASSDSEEDCLPEHDPLVTITAAVTTGSAIGATNDFAPSCGGRNGVDRVHILRVRKPLATLTIDTDGSAYDTVLALYDALCGTQLACDDESGVTTNSARIIRTAVAAGTYPIVVDAFNSTGTGNYTLRVAGTYAADAACDPAAPYFTCAPGQACHGAAGAETCTLTACNDAIDADGDGFSGFPNDPGCASPSDDDEADDCPDGPTCPACSNALDDDGDLLVDYPADRGCLAAGSTSEADCMGERDPVRTIASATSTGTTLGLMNDFVPACAMGPNPTAPDQVFFLDLAVPVASLVIDTDGSSYDTALVLTGGTCTPSLACDDDGGDTGNNSRLTRPDVAAGSYAIIVDGYAGHAGQYTLHVRGTIASGSSCNDPLVGAGVLACVTGTTCQAGLCAP